ncbi:hypothetical protein R1flu_022789 [Riccia fluitans]|uniref:Bifunctional inhibitor/plant lipid transfer protein/seed storage helical domain-containing protein n=1 Tax=Riccia fluitans TaxID=41844 RepID=A0ABD1XQB1_9MARC
MKSIIVTALLLALCLSFVVTAYAGDDHDHEHNHDHDHDHEHNHDHDHDHRGRHWPPGTQHATVTDDHDDHHCDNWNKYDGCLRYVKKGYYGDFPRYDSRCCKRIRDSSDYCLCRFFKYHNKNDDVDWDRIKRMIKSCGKKRARFDCW